MISQTQISFDDSHIRNIFLANLKNIRVLARHAILPPPNIKVSEWAESERYLPSGKWRNKKAPHTPFIMDWVNDPKVREITIMGSSQCAKTEVILNIIGYLIDVRPCRIILMFPTEKSIKDFVNTKLNPMISDTPALRKKVRDIKTKGLDKESGSFKRFPGGWLKIITGSSTAGTRGISADVTITDDVDQLVIGQQREGDPAERLKKRTTTNKYSSLNINVSTPTIMGQSRIDAYYGKSSMSVFMVACPHCNVEFNFESEKLVWKKDYEETIFNQDLPDEKKKVLNNFPETAVYPCPSCGSEITEAERLEMLENGKLKDRVHNEKHKGAWINEISSTLSSFYAVAKQIVEMNETPEKREVLYNTVFGLPYSKGDGEKVEYEPLLERVEPYIDIKNPFIVPNEIMFAVQSVDVQTDRLETLVLGVGYDYELWVLLYQVIPGDTTSRKIFNNVDKIYKANWTRQNGTRIPLLRMFVDSGYRQQVVFEYTQQKDRIGIMAIRGKGGYGIPILPKSFEWVIKKKIKRMYLGSNSGKEAIYTMLKINEPGSKYIHFCDAYCDKEFFKKLTVEQAYTKHTGLISYVVYDKPHKSDKNEPLDLMYYAYAAALHVAPNFKRMKANLDKLFKSLPEKTEVEENKPETIMEAPKISKPKKIIIKRIRRRDGFRN